MKTFEFSTLGSDAKDFFQEHGWLHITNVFGKEEIEQFRKNGKGKHAENHKGDLLSHPETNPIIHDERIVSVAKLLLDTEKPIYFGDSGCMIGSKEGAGFHKDNPDRIKGDASDWQSPYTILRMGIYLQDHTRHSGCLALRDGSHTTVKTGIGKPFFVSTNPGDLVIWYFRTTHSGNGKRLRFAPDFFLNLRLYKILPEFLFLPEENERMAFFMSFAKENDNHLKRLIHYFKTRTYMVEIWQNSQYAEKSLEEAKKVLDIMDVTEEARKIPLEQLNVYHKELED